MPTATQKWWAFLDDLNEGVNLRVFDCACSVWCREHARTLSPQGFEAFRRKVRELIDTCGDPAQVLGKKFNIEGGAHVD